MVENMRKWLHIAAASSMNRTKVDIMQLIRYAESLDSKVSEDSREALQGLINQGFFFLSSAWLIEVWKSMKKKAKCNKTKIKKAWDLR